ncbi:MAG: STAS domain-containing protein [Holophagales bacterium]|nr:STAS domain-containing protein [Holophagales bacterium]
MPVLDSEGRIIETMPLVGRLDAAQAPEIRRQIDEHLKEGRTRIIFDMREVSFVDSSGLAVFVNALKSARQAGGDIAILGPTTQVRSILELTRLHRILSIVDTQEEAVSAVTH